MSKRGERQQPVETQPFWDKIGCKSFLVAIARRSVHEPLESQLFIILCIPEGFYQNADFKIIIHLHKSDKIQDTVLKVESGSLGT